MVADNVRSYDSPLRTEQALRTRSAILAAARELFLERGYAGTTIEQIAGRACVSKPTVFAAVGNKSAVLKAVRDVAMAGDDRRVSVQDRPSVHLVRDAATTQEAVGFLAQHVTSVLARSGWIHRIIRGAAEAGDPDARELLAKADRERRGGAAALIAAVRAVGPLRISDERAADVLCAYMLGGCYEQLVETAGWTQAEFVEWFTATLRAVLC